MLRYNVYQRYIENGREVIYDDVLPYNITQHVLKDCLDEFEVGSGLQELRITPTREPDND